MVNFAKKYARKQKWVFFLILLVMFNMLVNMLTAY